MRTRLLPYLRTSVGVAVLGACAHTHETGPAQPIEPPLLPSTDAGGSQGDSGSADASGVVETIHGVTVRDPFRWLEDGNSSAVSAWTEEQDRRARAYLSALPMRSAFAERLGQISQTPRWTKLPMKRGSKYLYSRDDSTHERGAVYEYDPTSAKESLILDLSTLRNDGNLVSRWWSPSYDGRHAVFTASPNGGDEVQARVFDLRTKTWLPDQVAGARYAYPVWDPSGSGFYYTHSPVGRDLNADARTAQSDIRFHRVGTSSDKDVVLRDATGVNGVFEVPAVSPDGRWLLAARWFGTTRTTLFLKNLKVPGSEWRQFTPDGPFKYRSATAFGCIYILTNDGAARGHIFKVDPAHPERSAWCEVVPERDDGYIDDVDLVGSYLVVEYQAEGEEQHEVRRADGSFVKKLSAGDQGTIASVGGVPSNPEGAASFATYTHTYIPYLFRPPTFEFERFPTAIADSSAEQYVTQKVFYTAPDGARAPVYVVRSKATPPQSDAPMILSAYGGFGEKTVPRYKKAVAAWLDAGGIFAEAVIRGGGEFGEEWHHAGMKQGRAKVYSDFLAASEYLIKERWTDPTKLVIRGASAGGLLVAIAMTERPDLYAGVISEVPLTDMVRYPIGGSGPLWVGEYGSPDDAEAFPTLLRYSPYHNVKTGVRYPWLLIMSNAEDDRVNPMHARKFAAAVQSADPTSIVLLRTEQNASHNGAYTTSSWIDGEADAFAFARAAIAAHASP